MPTIISSPTTRNRTRVGVESTPVDFRHPNYDCREQSDAIKLVVYVPGVDPSGIEIASRGPDLVVTARKQHFVRVNFTALNLEAAQKDYLLKLRLGNGLDYENLSAEISDGILTVIIPKREAGRLRFAA